MEVVPPAADSQGKTDSLSLYDRLKPIIGAAKNLPPDASVNVADYLYGHLPQNGNREEEPVLRRKVNRLRLLHLAHPSVG